MATCASSDARSWVDERKTIPTTSLCTTRKGARWRFSQRLRRVPTLRARGKLDGIGAYANFDVTLPRRGFRLVLVDVHADPLMLRKPSLDEALAHGNHDPQCIIMGDFNTPLESVHFAPYRAAKMQDAFATAGRGFRETWFWGLPVLSLDHVWCGPSWNVVEARKIRDWSSDHDALLVTLR